MTQREDAALEQIREALRPRTATAERIAARALADSSGLGGRLWVPAGVATLAAALLFFMAWPSAGVETGSLHNTGEVFVRHSQERGWMIHNNPPPQPPTQQIILTGETR